ncbi:tetratricopeptide repeat protein [Streptomyces sp. NPDC002913]
MRELKSRLQEAKESQGKTEAWLVEVTKLSRGAVRSCLGGPSVPRADTVKRVSRSLKVRPGPLLELLKQARNEEKRRRTESRTWWDAGWSRKVLVNGANAQVREEDGRTSYFVTRSVPLRRRFSSQEARDQPSLLLRAEHQQIGFVGREPVLTTLREWRGPAGSGPAPVSVWLLHGPGGQGKSRLAIEFGRESRQKGWTVVQVRHGTDRSSGAAPEHASARKPGRQPEPVALLVIVDYAERWPQQDLIDFLSDCREQGTRRVRVLIIARSAGGWWSTPTRHLTDWGVPFGDLLLDPLDHDEGVDRPTLYARACEYFASAVDTGPPEGSRDLSGDGFSTVLAVHMAALADIEAGRRDEASPGSRAGISDYLMKREREHWEGLKKSGRVTVETDAFAQVVYTATLTGALPPDEARAALARVGIRSKELTASIVNDHAIAYPAHQFGTKLEPLHPDLFGEDFLALLLPADPALSLLSDDWAVDAPRRLIIGGTGDAPDGEDTPWTKPALITLIETARRWEHVTVRQLVPLLTDHPGLFLRAGSAALSRLADNRWIPEAVLDTIETRLPFNDVELEAAAAVLAERLTAFRLGCAGDDPYARVQVHRSLALRMEGIGEYARAAAEIRKDLEIRLRLTDMDESQLAEWALDLDWAGIIFHRNGDLQQALDASRKAAEIYTDLLGRLEPGNPELADKCRRRLTYALANISARQLPASVRRDTAYEGIRQSYLLIGEGDPTQDDVELAGCLQNLGNALRDLGEFEEAQLHLEKAVDIRRTQARRNFGRYAPLLASSFYALRAQYLMQRDMPLAAATTDGLVGILRQLAQANEAVYGNQLKQEEKVLRRFAGPDGPGPH